MRRDILRRVCDRAGPVQHERSGGVVEEHEYFRAVHGEWRGLGERKSAMSKNTEEYSADYGLGLRGKQSLVVRVTDNDFQKEVLEKLTRLEAKMDMLIGGSQPGRMQLAEERISGLERNDIRRSVYDRLVNAVITVAISAAIAMHDRWWR